MKIPYIITAPIILASSLLATPFDHKYDGESSVYVSILDKNHVAIRTEDHKLSYREFLKYNTRYIKNKNRDRYVYEIENYGTTGDGVLLGSMKITRSKDGKVLADYYFSSKNEFPNKDASTYEVDDNKGARVITKTNIVNPDFPHRRIICQSKEGGDIMEWLLFYPSYIGWSTLTKESMWDSSGTNTIILYCPKLGFIDFLGHDLEKTKKILYKEQEKLREDHPMNK